MKLNNNFWGFLILTFISLTACQNVPSEMAATEIVLPTATSSPIPASPSPTATASPTASPPPATSTLAPFPEEALESSFDHFDSGAVLAAISNAPLALLPKDHFYFSYPISISEAGRRIPSSRYGNDQKAENGAGHTGLDIGLDIGTSILAAAEGKVIFSGYGLLTDYDNLEDPYGLAIVIRHDFGHEGQPLYSTYSHLSVSQVELGQRVERGEQIGRSGDTGFSSGPHLHFEVRLGENTLYHSRNPELWISPPDGEGVLVGQLFTTYGARLIEQPLKITNLASGRIRWVYSYATRINIVPDDYFDENFVLGELPAGRYEIAAPYYSGTLRTEIVIIAGAISYFSFHGTKGFQFDAPALELPSILPQ